MTDFARRTIDLARQNVAEGGRPFATVIVQDGEVLAQSANKAAQTNDPTAHAEILAIRAACRKLGTEHLVDATIYVLAHPCPMCLGALYYCSPREVIFLTTRKSYEPYYVDDRKYFDWRISTPNSPSRSTSAGFRCATSRTRTPWTSTGCGTSATAAGAGRRWCRRTEPRLGRPAELR
ncbi:cytidine and deoxycytidylate deaminase zinc-binding region family protein [Mycobacterium avium MAV_120809_2495]|nr:cytidine and deoxycytidylate deaminase zinc-binding region family protein [Mycobacterium avium MAV_120809_2495]